MEKARRETEQKFKTLVEKCPASVMLFDEQGRVDFVNDWHMERFTNNKLGKDYFIGKSIHELPGLVNAGVDKEVARIFQGEYIEIEDVYFPEFAVGGSGWVNIRAVPIYKDGRIAGGILLRENITARKKFEIALHNSQQKYRLLVESVHDVIYIHTPEGHFTYLSPHISDLLGYEVQELIGKNFQDLIHPQDLPVMQRWLEEALKAGKRHDEIEHRILHKNGQWRWFNVHASSQINSEGEVESLLGVARDITDRKRAEEKVRLINQKLEMANSEKDKLFTIIAHDLKSPMGGVFSTSQLLAQEAEALPLDQIRFISTEMHKSMANALELLNDLMQWALMSQGGMDFSPEECFLDDLVNSNLHAAQDIAGKKEITIKPDIPEGLTVLVDQPMINTVIRNIIFNAVKFTNRGGNISITASNTDSDVEVCIQDDGIGMTDVMLSSIFTVEKSKRPLGTDGEKGTGLGLILCKEFVEKHGGKIWVQSELGKGTKVFFTLPGAL